MEGSSEEEEGDEREKLKCVAVTSEELFSSGVGKKTGSKPPRYDVLARRLQQWVDSHYDFTGSNDDVTTSRDTAEDDTTSSKGILLTSCSLHPVNLSPPPPPPPPTAPAHSLDRLSSEEEDEEEDEEERKRLLEAVIDPLHLQPPTASTYHHH